MTKAILVLDEMPTECDDRLCPFMAENAGHKESCFLKDNVTYGDTCPLKPMPLRRMHECVIVVEDKEYMRTSAFTDYDKGWNACLNEIEGKEE